MQQLLKDHKTALISDMSAEKCSSDFNDTAFGDATSFEAYVRNKEPFSELDNPVIAHCASEHFTTGSGRNKRERKLPQDKHKLFIAEYYNTKHQLESGLTQQLQDIVAINSLIGEPLLAGISCASFKGMSESLNSQCSALKQCRSSSTENLEQSAKDTSLALKAIGTIDREIANLTDQQEQKEDSKDSEGSKELQKKITELEGKKQSLQSFYPWIAGRIFQKGYDEDASEQKVAELIKKQLTHTKDKLEENMDDTRKTYGCLINNFSCREVSSTINLHAILAKTPPIDIEDIFERNNTDLINGSESQSLNSAQKTALRKDISAQSYFNEVQCRQNIREVVQAIRKELKMLAIDVGLTVATVGLGTAAILGKLSLRVGGNASKAQRLQNLGLIGLDVSFSVPYIEDAAESCEEDMNQLERLAGENSANNNSNNMCKQLSVRSKHTSNLRGCLLTASLASLPITIPLLGVAGRAIVKGVIKGGSKANKPVIVSSDPPKNPLLASFGAIDTFRNAYNKGQFTEDEVYITVSTTPTASTDFAKVVGMKEDTVVVDILYYDSQKIIRRALDQDELQSAMSSPMSALQFDRFKPKPVIVSGLPPKNPLLLSSNGEQSIYNLKFRQAYNIGQFTEDEVYIQTPHFFARIVEMKEGTIVVEILYRSGKVEKRALSKSELESAEISLISSKQFNQFEKESIKSIDSINIPRTNEEVALRAQGHRDIFIEGVDGMNRLQTLGQRLRERNINPFKTHVKDFADETKNDIKFIRQGLVSKSRKIKQEIEGSSDYTSSEKQLRTAEADAQLAEDLKILEDFAQEAKQRVKEERVTHHWKSHWSNRLTVLTTNKSERPILIVPDNTPEIRRINEDWWKTEENLDEYLDSEYIHNKKYSFISSQFNVRKENSVEYIEEAIRDFPDRIFLPTTNTQGIIAMNETMGTNISPSGMINTSTVADGALLNPADFQWHDLNDATLSYRKMAESGGTDLDFRKKFHARYKKVRQDLNKEDREKFETIYFVIKEDSIGRSGVQNLTSLNFNLSVIRFLKESDLGVLLPDSVNTRSAEAVAAYLRECAEKFNEIAAPILQTMK